MTQQQGRGKTGATMTNIATAMGIEDEPLRRIADGIAVAIAVSLPWSTSATGILVVIWLFFLLLTIEFGPLRRVVTTPAGGLPVLLVALGALGMLWVSVPWDVALRGFSPFAKLLVITLLLIQYDHSDKALTVFKGFLISCTALLALSWIIAFWPKLAWDGTKSGGVPVKDYIAQSGEFVICAFALGYIAIDRCKAGRHLVAIAFSMLAAAFLFNVFYIAASRTALVTIPILLIVLGARHFGWKGTLGFFAVGVVLGTLAWASSPYLRTRLTNVVLEVQAYQTDRAGTSAGERLDFWKKSLGFIGEAPLIGHGTGSIKYMFEKAAVGETGNWMTPSANPHNQVFAVGIQLGLLGIAVLFAMWISHLLLFRQPDLIAWIGLAVVVQNVVSSLFNSHLFDFTQGWTYVFGVGVAGGAMLRSGARQELATVEPCGVNIQGLDTTVSGARAQRPV